MNNSKYIEPEFRVVKQNTPDVLTASGGDDFNTMGDQLHSVYYRNTSWTIEL
ncbi:MAG: hypothetical protein IJI47_05735 [Eubacterium sp.]|nr:hypothetical protein [Eubacterium sp.]MBR0413047.1 hypothetical protein [Eubacterium sp.]